MTDTPPSPRHPGLDRVAAAFVLALLAIGALALWTGVPLATAWAISKVTETSSTHFLAGLIGIPLAMALFAPALFWLNGLYLRIRWASASVRREDPDEEWDSEDDEALIPRGPIEPLLLISFAVALIALLVWFFVFAENPELAAF